MPWTTESIAKGRATRARNRMEKKRATNELAKGVRNGVDVTPAAWRTATHYVPDFHYVNDAYEEGLLLVRQSEAGIVWAHRLVRPAHPFEDMLQRIDWSCSTISQQDLVREKALVKQRSADKRKAGRALRAAPQNPSVQILAASLRTINLEQEKRKLARELVEARKRVAEIEELLRQEDVEIERLIRERNNGVQTQDSVPESLPVSASGVPRPSLRTEGWARHLMPHQYRAVQALLATRVLRAPGESDDEMTRPAEERQLAEALAKQGLLHREIAAALNVPKPTISRWLNVELEERERGRARKLKYTEKKKCPNCGKRISNNAHLCLPCFNKEQKKWPRDRVIEAIQQWAVEHGAPPKYQEWVTAGKGHPAIWTIISGNTPAFSSWSEAILAAGLTPGTRRHAKFTPGERAKMRRQAREETIKRAVAKGEQ